jgi:hypothetical protein
MTWAEFRTLVTGLLQTDSSRLWRATRPPEPEPDKLPEGFGAMTY